MLAAESNEIDLTGQHQFRFRGFQAPSLPTIPPRYNARMAENEDNDSDLPPIWWLKIYWSLIVVYLAFVLGAWLFGFSR
jgi:hypothetical protein